ncbi:MAG: sugar ABC transporter permease [Anaerolineaceae bacterium]|nr:MAG: sugar ABC transporter permease [Anaerolineaceae bacterium]
MKSKFGSKRKEGLLFTLPALIYMLALIGYSLIYNIILSFKNMNVRTFKGGNSVFVGLDNYIELFKDPVFLMVLKNTFIFTIACLAIQFTFGLIFALLFSKKFPLSGVIRGLLLVSYMLPMSVSGLLWRNMYGLDGVFNTILMSLGIIRQPIEWIVSTKTALLSLIITNSWIGIPFNMLLMTTGLTNISKDVYEAAEVDGATKWKKFRYITAPLLKPAALSSVMLVFIYTFRAFDLMFIMTGGGPLHSTDVLGTLSYSYSFTQYKFSLGAATAVVLFAILFVVGLIYLHLTTKEEAS